MAAVGGDLAADDRDDYGVILSLAEASGVLRPQFAGFLDGAVCALGAR